jgi:hypothetical protein
VKILLVSAGTTLTRTCAPIVHAAATSVFQGRGVPIAGRLIFERGSATPDLPWTLSV